jgi:putative transport protein
MYLIFISFGAAFFALLTGFLIGRYVFKLNWILLAGGMCGAMTSTPGLGAAIDATGDDNVAVGYGAAYPFALFAMVVFTIILHNLPM